MTTKQVFSDATQLAGVRQAIASIEKDRGLTESQQAYWRNVLDSIGDRIEDAAARKKAAKGAGGERQDPRAVGPERSERQR